MSYSHYDEDPWADTEALDNQRHEADLEQARMDAAGNAIAAAQARGVCTHGSAQGYHGGPRSAQQQGLKPGQVRCAQGGGAGCGAVWDSDQEWQDAIERAVYG